MPTTSNSIASPLRRPARLPARTGRRAADRGDREGQTRAAGSGRPGALRARGGLADEPARGVDAVAGTAPARGAGWKTVSIGSVDVEPGRPGPARDGVLTATRIRLLHEAKVRHSRGSGNPSAAWRMEHDQTTDPPRIAPDVPDVPQGSAIPSSCASRSAGLISTLRRLAHPPADAGRSRDDRRAVRARDRTAGRRGKRARPRTARRRSTDGAGARDRHRRLHAASLRSREARGGGERRARTSAKRSPGSVSRISRSCSTGTRPGSAS